MKRRTLKREAETRIDEVLVKKGVKAPSDATDGAGRRHFIYRDADGVYYVDNEGSNVVVRAAAEVLPLPSDAQLVIPLMRELLEKNGRLRGSARLAILDGRVYACAAQRADFMKVQDYASYIDDVMKLGNTSMNALAKRYGGTTQRRHRPSRQE